MGERGGGGERQRKEWCVRCLPEQEFICADAA